MQKDDTELWRLRHEGRRIECVVRFAPGGVEVEISANGNAIIEPRVYDRNGSSRVGQ